MVALDIQGPHLSRSLRWTASLLTALWFIVSRREVFQSLFFTNTNTHIIRKSFIINVIKSPYWGKSVQRDGVFQTGIFLDWLRLLARFAFTDKGIYQWLSAASDWLRRMCRNFFIIHFDWKREVSFEFFLKWRLRCISNRLQTAVHHTTPGGKVLCDTHRKGKTGRTNLF